MYLDAAAIGLPAVLGLLGAWLGFGRSLVSWPIRWLVSLFGACVAALLAALYLVVNEELLGLLYLSGTFARTAVCAIAFLVTLLMLLMFMSNLRERVLAWTGHRRIGSMERVFGVLLGIACGFLLVAIPYLLYLWMWPSRDDDPPWARESLSLPYFRSAGEALKSAWPSYLSSPAGKPRSQR